MNEFYYLTNLFWKGQKNLKRKGIILAFLSISFFTGYSSVSIVSSTEILEFQESVISGTVIDNTGMPLPGVNVVVLGTKRGVQTDLDGNYEIKASTGETLVFSYLGFKTQQIKIGSSNTIDVSLVEDLDSLEEVVIVGYDTQTKLSLVGSVTSVTPSDLKIPSSNLTTAFAGRVAGMIAFQNSGEPGQDNAEFFIRGATTFGIRNSPLILIDNIELSADDLGRLNPDDIETFSIFKDATATAIYGARGANGVIAVTTKSGEIGKPRVNVRYETSISTATKNIDIADPLTYIRLHNEAVRTRDPLQPLPYAQNKLDNTLVPGSNINVYPYTDWQEELIADTAINQRLNFSVAGGGEVARYFVAGGVSQDNGVLKVDKRANFNNNIDLKQFYLRSNINIDLTPTTEAVVRLNATIDDYTGPIPSGSQVYNMVMRSNPVRFPAYFEPDAANEFTQHILFGNDSGGNEGGANFLNPYAQLVSGYRDYSRSLNLVQLELKQDLKGITPGLRWRFLGNVNRTSTYGINRAYFPYYYEVDLYNPAQDEYTLSPLNEGTEFLNFLQSPNDRTVNTVTYLETAFNYDLQIKEKHAISALLVGIMREAQNGNANTLQLSLPSRNIGVSGRVTYNYDKRYFTEFNFGYNGSERFAENNRFGFFPSFGAGWVVSNEKFWNIDFINRFKLRGSYGVIGNDAIGTNADRFFYLSEVNLIDGGAGANFGQNYQFFSPGVSISRYANDQITWEKSFKQNYGAEFNFFKDAIQLQAEYFAEKRTNILQQRQDIPTLVGLQDILSANIGEAKSHGFEISLDINHTFNKDLWVQFTGNYVDTKSEFTVYEENDYAGFGVPWRSRIGQPLNQAYGLVAERLFVDEADVANSPAQEFGETMGGDIKYVDINGDGKISTLDIVPIGESTQPEISYGFGFSVGYKKWDLSAFFQGLDRFSFFIDSSGLTPFADTDTNADYLSGATAENQILQAFADSHWSEDNRDIYATWPRLSTYEVANNSSELNTWFMRDGAFMRLKSMEIGYTLGGKAGQALGLATLRLYANGTNLATWSKFKLWDPELRGNGLNYPLQRVINIGAKINF